jgi:tetratricopeptide (TPR) repeat protein
MGPKLTYRVAMDDRTRGEPGAMAATWMEAAGQDTIPCSFIVNQQGKVAWIGHPLSMDQPLADVIAGKHDLAGARAEHVRQLQWRKSSTELERLAGTGSGRRRSPGWTRWRRRTRSGRRSSPRCVIARWSRRGSRRRRRRSWTRRSGPSPTTPRRAVRIADAAYELKQYDAALKLATAAAPHAKELAYYAYLLQGFVHAAHKNWDQAIEAQKHAVGAAPDTARRNMEQILEKYEQRGRGERRRRKVDDSGRIGSPVFRWGRIAKPRSGVGAAAAEGAGF